VSLPPSEIDVLVAGFGAAGAAAAIAAHDAGASVAICEKWPAGGRNCVHSGGFLFEVDGPHAVEHLDALCFGKTDRRVLEAFAAGLSDVPAWIESLGGATAPCDPGGFGGMLPSWPHFPGAGHVRYRQFVPREGERPGIGLWRTLRKAVRDRGIPVAVEARAVELAHENGRVHGAVIEQRGERSTIRAQRAVVLASGGFEYNAELVDTYLPLPLVGVGHPGNTGDTIHLAQRAGASLWHMSAFFGWLAFVHPDHPAGFTLDVHAPSFIFIDGDGRRFADETGWEAHAHRLPSPPPQPAAYAGLDCLRRGRPPGRASSRHRRDPQ
jgi:succinate dehydrogenase/fumarate reductase flavoprotein subunit